MEVKIFINSARRHVCIIFIRKGDEPLPEVSLEERSSDDGLEVDRDSFIVPGDLADLVIKEQTINEPLNAKYPEVNEALETPGNIRSSCQITDTDSRGREHLNDVNEKISVKLRQLETDNNIHQAHFLNLEAEPDWITKIKTFKITKVKFFYITMSMKLFF